MKTSELTGAALDWAVAKAEGADMSWDEVAEDFFMGMRHDLCFLKEFKPSTDWAQGGPIIEREGIMFQGAGDPESMTAYLRRTGYALPGCSWAGPTHLIAAMRCYVASELGDEVDVPEELL
jgi:hypothetical protein